jgi:hypothetical protein
MLVCKAAYTQVGGSVKQLSGMLHIMLHCQGPSGNFQGLVYNPWMLINKDDGSWVSILVHTGFATCRHSSAVG